MILTGVSSEGAKIGQTKKTIISIVNDDGEYTDFFHVTTCPNKVVTVFLGCYDIHALYVWRSSKIIQIVEMLLCFSVEKMETDTISVHNAVVSFR